MRRRLLPLLLLFAVACAQPPVNEDMTIEFANDDSVTVTVVTTFNASPRTEAARKRVDAAREAAQAGTDAWSVRFGRLSPESEEVTMKRLHGELNSVTRSVRIAEDELQHLFSDTPVTVSVMRGEGWRELAIYPGSAGRATREQQRRFNEQLDAWSGDVARYINTVYRLYAYLDHHPDRANDVYVALMADPERKEETTPLTEQEEPLVKAVIESIGRMWERVQRENAQAESLDESADLIFNPFPATIQLRLPNEVISKEGFGDELVIVPVALDKAIAALEGRWISPDLLSESLRDEHIDPKRLAALPRRAISVANADEVAAALKEQFALPRRYVVRWRD